MTQLCRDYESKPLSNSSQSSGQSSDRADSCSGRCPDRARNKVTAEQLDKITRFAYQFGNNCILLMPDCGGEGEVGFKELLWKLCEAQVQVQLGWSSKTHASQQPESLTQGEWQLPAGNSQN